MNSAGEEWGEDSLVRTLQSCRDLTAHETAARITSAAGAFAAGATQHDDMTIIVLRVL